MAFLVAGVGAIVAALDRWSVGGKVPKASAGNGIVNAGHQVVDKLRSKNLGGGMDQADPTVSGRMQNEVRALPGHLVAGFGRLVHFGEFVVYMMKADRLQATIHQMKEVVAAREVEVDQLKDVVACNAIVLQAIQNGMVERDDLEEQGVMIVQVVAADFAPLMPSISQIDQFMAEFARQFNELLQDQVKVGRMKGLIAVNFALQQEVDETTALEKELAQVTKGYEELQRRKEKVNLRLARVSASIDSSNALLVTAANASVPSSPLRQKFGTHNKPKVREELDGSISVET